MQAPSHHSAQLTRPDMARVVALLLATLIPAVLGGASVEDVTGVYRPLPGRAQSAQCPEQFKVGTVQRDKTALVETNPSNCDGVYVRFAEVSRQDVRGDNVTRHLVTFDGEVVGTLVTGEFSRAVKCDGADRRDEVRERKVITILRPFAGWTERIWRATFRRGEYYIAMRRTAVTNYSNAICVYSRTRSEVAASPSEVPPLELQPPAEGISMWAWLGPLIGGVVIVGALLIALFVKRRSQRWYPFQSSTHEDVSEAEFFGRLSQQDAKHSRSLDRGPSGVIFTDAMDRKDSKEHSSSRVVGQIQHNGDYPKELP